MQVLSDASDSVTCIVARGAECIVGSADGCVRTYDVRRGSVTVDTIAQPVASVALSHDSLCVLVATLDSRVRLLDRQNGKALATYAGHVNTSARTDAVLTPDDACVLAGSEDGRICAWELVHAQPLPTLRTHTGAVTSLSVTAAQQGHPACLLSSSVDGSARVWRHYSQP